MMMMWRAGVILPIIVVLLAGISAAAPRPGWMDVKASLTGTVVADDMVEVGARVEDGQPLVYVRTLTQPKAVAATAPRDGTVREVLVKTGQKIERGDVVVRIEPR